MPPKSKISQLPEEIQTLIQTLLRGGESIQTITNKLNELDFDVSRSSVGRYTQNLTEVMSRYKEIAEFAKAMGSNIEDSSHSEISKMNGQLLQAGMFKILMSKDDQVVLDAKEAMQIASALEKLSKSQKLDTDRELIIREEAAKDALKQAAEIMEKTATEAGVSQEKIDSLKEDFLGIKVG